MNYNDIKDNYEKGYWSAVIVKMAVKKGVISKDQYKEITGFTYPATK